MTDEPQTPFWTVEDYLDRSRDPDPRVRAWAMARLEDQHPLQAVDRAVEALGDRDSDTRFRAFSILDEWGDASLAPRVLPGLADARGDELLRRAELLAAWNCAEAVEPLVAHMNRGPAGKYEQRAVCLGLGVLAPERLRPWVKQQILAGERQILNRDPVVRGLALCHNPADIGWMVDRWLETPPRGRLRDEIPGALEEAVGPSWLARFLPYEFEKGAAAVAVFIEGQEPNCCPFTVAELDALLTAALAGESGWWDDLLREAHAAVADRQLPVEAWRDSGERPEAYRWQVLATLGLLEHLATFGDAWRSVQEEDRRQLVALSLAGLVGILADQDDVAWLEQRRDDRREALLELLASPRERITHRLDPVLAELGPSILPLLPEFVAEPELYWAAHRTIRVIRRMAAHDPQACLSATEDLLDATVKDQGDYLCDSSIWTLQLLGPGALPAVERRLRDIDDEFGMLSDVIACYPVPRSVEILHDLYRDEPEGPRELISAISRLAHESSIEFLLEEGVGEANPALLARTLLELCAIHGVSHPLQERWQRILKDAKAGKPRRAGAGDKAARMLKGESDGTGVSPRSTPERPSGDDEESKKRKIERRRRRAQRRKQRKVRGKKKKRKGKKGKKRR